MKYPVSLVAAVRAAKADGQNPEAFALVAAEWMKFGMPEKALPWAYQAKKLASDPSAYEPLVERASQMVFEQLEADDEEPLETTNWNSGLNSPAGMPQEFAREENTDKIVLDRLPMKNEVDRQLGLLLGDHVLRPETGNLIAPDVVTEDVGRARWGLRLMAVAAVAAVVFGGRTAYQLTVEKKLRAEIVAERAELPELLRVGSHTLAAEVVERLTEADEALGIDASADPLIARADAVLYRKHDADPERRARLKTFFETRAIAGQPDAMAASAIVRSRSARLNVRAALIEQLDVDANDVDVPYALATSSVRADQQTEADEQFATVEFREPANQFNLMQIIRSHLAAGRSDEAEQLLAQMRDVDPESAFTHVAGELVERKPIGEDVKLPPVAQYWVLHERVLREITARDDEAAKTQLVALRECVGDEPAFILDMAEALVLVGKHRLAEFAISGLEEVPLWERDSLASLQFQLSMLRGDPWQPKVLEAQVARGETDPRLGGFILAQFGERVDGLAERLLLAWPNRKDFALAYAEHLVRGGDFEAAQRLLVPLTAPARRSATPQRMRARALGLAAKVAFVRGENKKAQLLAKRGLRLDKKEALCVDVLQTIKREERVAKPAKKRRRRGKRRRRTSGKRNG